MSCKEDKGVEVSRLVFLSSCHVSVVDLVELNHNFYLILFTADIIDMFLVK